VTGDYWVEITQGDNELGAGFLLTTCYVLTALHCLDRIAADDDAVNILAAGGQSIPGRVYRRSPAADLALIDIPERGTIQLKVPSLDRAAPGGNWRSPYRPTTGHAQLSGKIDAFPVPYHCEGGDDVEAMQLECAQPLGDYSGYSGGPIERDGPDESQPVLGLLIEQYPDQYPDNQIPKRASTVLFAVAIAEVFRRFDCFDVAHLLNVLAAPSDEISSPAQPAGTTDNARPSPTVTVDSLISDAEKKLKAIDEWENSLLRGVDLSALAALKLRIVQSIVDGGLGGSD
jgi:hypothetical protein